MVKTTVTLLIVLAVILAASFFENNYLVKNFDYFDKSLDEIIENTDKGEDSSDKLFQLTKWWKDKKNVLHAFVPHSDIRDIDGLMVEANKYIKNEMYNTAAAKLQKLDDMIVSITQNYSFNFGNIF